MTTADPTCFECGKPATNYSCGFGPDTGLMDPALNACAEHKCRCRQPAMYMAPEPRPEEPTRQEPDVVTVAARHLLHAVDSGSDSTDERRVLAALVWPPGSLAQAPRSSQAEGGGLLPGVPVLVWAGGASVRGVLLDLYDKLTTMSSCDGAPAEPIVVPCARVRLEDGSISFPLRASLTLDDGPRPSQAMRSDELEPLAARMAVGRTNAVVRSVIELRVEALEAECATLRTTCALLVAGLHGDAERALRPMKERG